MGGCGADVIVWSLFRYLVLAGITCMPTGKLIGASGSWRVPRVSDIPFSNPVLASRLNERRPDEVH